MIDDLQSITDKTMALSYAEQFTPSLVSCKEIQNAGSILLVASLPSCTALEPTVHTLTCDTLTAINDEEIDLTSDITPGGTFLRKGTVLHFPAGTVVVTADTTVTTGTTVPTEPQTAAITAATTATTWALLKLVSPINIPFNVENQTEDRTDLNTIDGSMVKVKREFNPQIQAFARSDDKALWEVVFPAAVGTQNIYAHIVRSSGQHAFGVAQVNGWNSDGAVSALDKPQFTLNYQGEKGLTSPWSYLSTANKTLLNDVAKLSGLNIYS